jgi:hypothetical protein
LVTGVEDLVSPAKFVCETHICLLCSRNES